ncbi:MAG TPA: hypothetical protein VK020_10890, partial [Microlunatus sp.]|nr:hypothetical protein [Microlunatus sp.]
MLQTAFSVGMTLGGVLVATVLAGRSRIGSILFATVGVAVITIATTEPAGTPAWIDLGIPDLDRAM